MCAPNGSARQFAHQAMADAVIAGGSGGSSQRGGRRRGRGRGGRSRGGRHSTPAASEQNTDTDRDTEAEIETGGTSSKRKRADTAGAVPSDAVVVGDEDVPSTDSAEATSSAIKPATKRKAPAKKNPAIKKEDRNASADCGPTPRSIDAWPEWFRALEKTHRALNLVYTICCTRKHLLTTFATIKTTVESNTGRPLLETEVAAVAALLSLHFGGTGGHGGSAGTIRFAYVDELSLQVDIQGLERDTSHGPNQGDKLVKVARAQDGDGATGNNHECAQAVFEPLDAWVAFSRPIIDGAVARGRFGPE